jgi:hypothetical protein
MAASALWELQTAVYSYLSTYLPLSLYKVYDGAAPAAATVPYIVMGEWTETPANLHNRLGRSITDLFHIWSAYLGDKEVKQIGDLLIAALEHNKELVLTSWHVATADLESANVMMDTDTTRQGLYRFRFFLEAK